MSKLNYGVFGEFWDGHPNHLPFLHLHEIPDPSSEFNLAKSIDILDLIISTNSEASVTSGINLLLASENWRPHLVAALAVLKINKVNQSAHVPALWDRLQHQSWVSPQILVVLSMIDPEFTRLAEDIRVQGYRVNYSSKYSLKRNRRKGPIELTADHSKLLASVQYLLKGIIVDTDENEGGGSLAKNWKNSLLQLIESGRFKLSVEN